MSVGINVRSELDKTVEVTVCEGLSLYSYERRSITLGGSGGITCESSRKDPGERNAARAVW